MRTVSFIWITAFLMAVCVVQASSGESSRGFYLAPAQPMVQNERIMIKFCWEPLQGAKSYTILVAKDSLFKDTIAKKTSKDTLFVLQGLDSKVSYFWKVSAVDSKGQKVWNAGGVQTFVTPIVVLPAKAEIPRGQALVDGIVSPGEWDGAARMSLQYFGGQSTSHPNPEAQMMWNDSALYILIKTTTPDGNPPRISVTDRDGAVYSDDAFEIFLTTPDSTTFYQFIFNWSGVQYDGKGADASFNCNWSAKTTVSGTNIIAEVAIPWNQIEAAPKAGESWKFNLAVDFNRQTLVRTWSKYGFMLGDTKTFGTIVLGN